MRLPKTPLAVAASVGAFGAWYAYGNGQTTEIHARDPVSSAQTRSLSSTPDIAQPTAEPSKPAPVTAGHKPTRRALVVDDDQFFTGDIVGDGPLTKDTDDYGRKVLEMMTPQQATERLRKNEESILVNRGRGVVRYDIVQLPSNDPIEDDHAEKTIQVSDNVAHAGNDSSSDWMFWGVFDGHSGWTTSARLRQVLIQYAARELNATYTAALASKIASSPSPEAIDQALKLAFTKLDNEICHESVKKLGNAPSKSRASELLAPALSGSCALLSFYDSHSRNFRVACTGDSRAVLGRRNPSTGKWSATPLSEDQTGSNPNEAKRMRAEHPGEDRVVHAGRVLGNLEPTRAFGDAAYKWSRETQDRIKRHFFGRNVHPLLKTPPYVTAEPVVTTTGIEPGKGGRTGGPVVEQQNREAKKSSSTAWLTDWFKSAPTSLPVEKGGNMDKTGRVSNANDPKSKMDKPIRQEQWALPSEDNGRFVVEDKNAATHLVRNALGGKDRDMVCALLSLPSPYSRRYRDDLTVEVIFFGESEGTGDLAINQEATTNGTDSEPKAKL
ncbi:Protein phosphatase-like protein [Cyphellophora attinorum]|uniref:Protein phosphatase-like protein n=1 Tax=Cyphellophora attinorum TaxID=1664694 RepID=A0A0N0NPX0_9EURO|nr:Protein phosphatase-like protein [Phialophora attinorum]KPI43019.1 Protein phosphatase-like protein [Phialophora attinorum]